MTTDLLDNKWARIFAGLAATFVWIVLVIQFYLQLTNPDVDVAIGERIVRFFSYFTTLTNIIVATAWTAVAFFPGTRIGGFFCKASMLTAVAVYISIVGLIYSLFLRGVWNPAGWQKFADHSLHDASPIFFVVFWLVFVEKGELRWNDPLKWLGYPLVYVLYSLVRGAFVNWYPYWFADASTLGYPAAFRNALLVLVAFLIIGLIFTAIGKLARKKTVAAAS
ncbi:MAG: Pr6Pr family membrane protein [Acidobacteriota bacterium]